MSEILIIANDESTILNFRREIISAFVKNKYNVTVCYPLGKHSEEIESLGCKLIDIKVSRHGTNPVQDLGLLVSCKRLIKEIKPDVVLTYTVKPNIYGSIACRITHTPFINNITGLGSVLQKESILSKIVLKLQKIAYKKSSCVFFQNEENCKRLKEQGIVSEKTPVEILPGSGVNLQKQKYELYPENDSITRFMIVSRIRRDKGYSEFFDAAEEIKNRYPDTEFHVIGWYEEDELHKRLDELKTKDVIIYHGQVTQEEVHEITKTCSCIVHPSYHEGMANVLLEAAASGRPVIATEIPGCKETFDEGITGFGCKVHDTASLVSAMEKFLALTVDQRKQMGIAGRAKMEKEFDRNSVAERYIGRIETIIKKKV